MSKQKKRLIVPDMLKLIENAQDIDTVIIIENKLACMFASLFLFFIGAVSFILRTAVYYQGLTWAVIDSISCIVLGITFEIVLHSKMKASGMVNAVSALYGVWFIFLFLRMESIFGPLIWIIACVQVIVAVSQISKRMLMVCSTVISASAAYSYFTGPDDVFHFDKIYYMLLIVLLLIALLIAAAVHRAYVNRYEKLVKSYKIVLDQKKEMEELFEEVTASEEKLQYLAYHDILTKLPNRILVNQKLDELINIAKENNHNIYIVYIDIDYFKNVNDTLGHDAGDQFISILAGKIREALHPEDLFGRMHGDEFILIIPRAVDEVEVYLYLNSLKDLFEDNVTIKGIEVNSTASMGVAVFPKDGTDAVTLIRNADIAMYKSKERGKNVIQFFYPELKENMQKRSECIMQDT